MSIIGWIARRRAKREPPTDYLEYFTGLPATGDRRQICIRITGDASGAMRQLTGAQRMLGRVAAWSAQRTAELPDALRRAREANRLALWRRLAEVDPQLRVFTVTIATPRGSECRTVVQRSDWRRMPAPTTEKE